MNVYIRKRSQWMILLQNHVIIPIDDFFGEIILIFAIYTKKDFFIEI